MGDWVIHGSHMALKSVRITAHIPGELKSLMDVRVREENYPSVSAYLAGLVVFDLHCRGPHVLFGPLMSEPIEIRDAVIAELVRDFDKPDLERGCEWLERRIADLVRQFQPQPVAPPA